MLRNAYRERRDAMRIVIGTDEWVAVAFNVYVAEFIHEHALARNRAVATLGERNPFPQHVRIQTVRQRHGRQLVGALAAVWGLCQIDDRRAQPPRQRRGNSGDTRFKRQTEARSSA